MNARPTLERRVTDWLQAEAPARAPDRVLATTLDRVAVVGQERTLTQWRFRDRSRSNRAALIAATAALIAILAAGAVLVGSRTRTEEAPSPPPSAPALRTLGQGPTLTWNQIEVLPWSPVGFTDTRPRAGTRVAWIGARFVLIDEQTQTVAKSPDGSDWTVLTADDPEWDWFRVVPFEDSIASWGDAVVSWSPSTPGAGIRIRRPPDAPSVAAFDGTVDAAGIGPAGIVVSSHTEFDQFAFIESVLGPTWAGDSIAFSGLQDGVLMLGSHDGRTASINLADHGVTEAQFENRGEGWHSVDGTTWTPIPEWPGKVTSIVGTADGFFAIGDAGTGPRMFHSDDGFDWQRKAIATEGLDRQVINPVLLPWADGALQSDGTFIFESWTADGRQVLPIAAEVRSRDHPLMEGAGIGAGPLGIVVVEAFFHEILYSPDGVRWVIQTVPDPMYGPGPADRRYRSSVAVGAGAVVVVMSEGANGEESRPSLWVGTPAP